MQAVAKKSNSPAIVLAVVAILMVVGGALALSQSSDNEASPQGLRRQVESGGFCNGQATEVQTNLAGVQEVAQAVEFTVFMPDHPQANLANLNRMQFCPNATADNGRRYTSSRLEFQGGIAIVQEWTSDTEKQLDCGADSTCTGISETTVHGRKASLHEVMTGATLPGDPESWIESDGSVSWIEGGSRVLVLGNGEIDAEVLHAIGESTTAVKPAT